jgi:hypothetical protein
MPNMKTVVQRNLKLLGGQGKTDGRPDRRTDKLIPVYPPYNFVVLGYKNYWQIIQNLNFNLKHFLISQQEEKMYKHMLEPRFIISKEWTDTRSAFHPYGSHL